MKDFFRKHFLVGDFIICLFIIVLIFVLNYVFDWELFEFINRGENLKDFYQALFSGAISIFLFLITSISVLLAFLDNEKLKFLQGPKHPKTMLEIFFSAAVFSGILALFLILSFFFYDKKWLFWIAGILTVSTITKLCRVIWVFKNLTFIQITF